MSRFRSCTEWNVLQKTSSALFCLHCSSVPKIRVHLENTTFEQRFDAKHASEDTVEPCKVLYYGLISEFDAFMTQTMRVLLSNRLIYIGGYNNGEHCKMECFNYSIYSVAVWRSMMFFDRKIRVQIFKIVVVIFYPTRRTTSHPLLPEILCVISALLEVQTIQRAGKVLDFRWILDDDFVASAQIFLNGPVPFRTSFIWRAICIQLLKRPACFINEQSQL